MSFLDELENNKSKQKDEKTPRQLWESCFKYFKHFVSILKQNEDEFEAEFNLISLNIKQPAKITGPYEISRVQIENGIALQVKMTTQLDKKITIKRKDKRSAEILKIKLSKEGLLSTVKSTSNNQHYVELSQNISSSFKIVLHNNSGFQLEYKNVNTSNHRTIKVPVEDINQEYMDKLAKYIIGKNQKLYKETLSEGEISKIRSNLAQKQLEKKLHEKKIQQELQHQRELEEIKKANTIKEKSKRYLANKSRKLKKSMVNKLTSFKKKI